MSGGAAAQHREAPPAPARRGAVPLLVLALLLLACRLGAQQPAETPVPLPGPFAHDAGRSWLAPAPAGWAGDDVGGQASRLVLLEDGRPLGPAHALHDEIRRLGGGRFSHWRDVLYFSTSDDSDPNDNGRHYEVALLPPPGLGEALWNPRGPGERFAAVPVDAPRSRPAPLRPDAPELVWIHVIDALRPDDAALQLPDGPLMPALAALAGEAVSFANAYASSSFTKTSTASLFTGLWPTRHRVRHGLLPAWPEGVELLFDLDPRFTTLAEWAADQGYLPVSHPYSLHVRPGDGMLQGFARLDLAAGQRVALQQLPARALVYEHVLGVHGPYDPSQEARARLGLPPREQAPAPGAVDPASTDWFEQPLDADDVALLRRHYRAEAVDADRQLAERIAWLRELGLWERTLFIVTADHGEAFLEHGSTQHSVQLHEEAVRVPLLVRFPAGHPLAAHHGRVLEPRVGLVDLFPTLAEVLTGAPPALPYALDGASLLPLLAAGAPLPQRDVVLAASFSRTPPGGGAPTLFLAEALLHGPRKIHVGWRLADSQDPARFPYRLGEWQAELYDLATDPGEMRDLAPRDARAFLDLLRRLEATRAPLAGTRPATPEAVPASATDRDLLERLEALGYVR